MLFALGFLTMFTLGGISGVMLAMVPLDIHVSDTYFIVAHIHYVLFGGSLFTIYAGVYYWFPKMTGRMFDERLGKLHFWLTFVVFNATFAPMHLIGVQGMPRRVADYPEQFAGWNLFISLASSCSGCRRSCSSTTSSLVARRPARGGEPVARAHARVAGVLAAADLQLRPRARPSSAGPTSTACPGAVHGIFQPRRGGATPKPAARRPADGREEAEDGGRSSSSRTRRSAAASCWTRSASARAGRRALPRGRPADAPAPRQRDLRRGGARLRAGPRRPGARVHARGGHRGTGEVGDSDPMNAARDAIAEHGITEISSRRCPRSASGWMRRDLIQALENETGLPSGHVVVDLAGRAGRST